MNKEEPLAGKQCIVRVHCTLYLDTKAMHNLHTDYLIDISPPEFKGYIKKMALCCKEVGYSSLSLKK